MDRRRSPARRSILGLVLALTLAGGTSAWATSLAISPRTLGGGTAAVPKCDSDGFEFRYAINTSSQMTSVRVTGIDGTCAGGTLRVTLTNGATSVGSGSVAVSGPTATVPMSPTPASNLVTATYSVIEIP